ncbi:hypothetical protein NFI96_010176 [Prochilodus magdalenae]|nr:hypothetical protein NFI96_010176 [Prochilodus magdalenae]
MVTVRPNFQDSVHVGYIGGLKKFTQYYTSVLCFTTPGDGPRSTAKRIHTHEDTPGAVGHLSFTEILDTSLKVSWREPNEKNGILTGYRISWEEYNRTNTRVTHYLPNVTLEYRVTGLTALTTYTIEVAAMTSKGQGQLSSSTISSGVPPELPGPPTNLAISNIGPRSVTLQFKPGYDGKTSISRWQVEAQISVVGENEDWVMVHQLANEPDARSLEVPGLNPYTFYRYNTFTTSPTPSTGTTPSLQALHLLQVQHLHYKPYTFYNYNPFTTSPTPSTGTAPSLQALHLLQMQHLHYKPYTFYNYNPFTTNPTPSTGTTPTPSSGTTPSLQALHLLQVQHLHYKPYTFYRYNTFTTSPTPSTGTAPSLQALDHLQVQHLHYKPYTFYSYNTFTTSPTPSTGTAPSLQALHLLQVQHLHYKPYTFYRYNTFTTNPTPSTGTTPSLQTLHHLQVQHLHYKLYTFYSYNTYTIFRYNTFTTSPTPSTGTTPSLQTPHHLQVQHLHYKLYTFYSYNTYTIFRYNTFTIYRFRMRQVNIVGTSPPSQPSRKIQTLQAPPDMAPVNVTLRTASETSLWLRWVPLPEWEYNGNPESVGYRVQYSRTGPQAKALIHLIPDRLEREFTIEDLEEWTEYEVKVQAVNGIGAGPWSQPVRGRTRESVPSCGPTNVSAFATTSSSILVRWFEVPEPDRNGLILGYKLEHPHTVPADGAVGVEVEGHQVFWTCNNKPFILVLTTVPPHTDSLGVSTKTKAGLVVYKEKDSDSPLQFWTVEGNSTHSVQLTGLGKYVLYEIQVLAFTRIGDGRPSSPPILERTLDDVPGPPVGILFPEVRTTSVRLIWQSPSQPNGIILAYQITYRLNSTNSNTATVDVLNPSARQYTVTALKPESVYVFRITAQTRKGWGEAAEALVVTTEKRARPQPTSRPTVPQENVQARSVLLSWEPGSDGLSPVRYYTVQVRELPSRNWTVHSASVSHDSTSYIVDRLKPFTSYQFRVKATNDIGDSDYSQESEAITTLQDAPDESPIILSVTPHTTTSVLIRWQPPAEEKINGIPLGFRIRYRELLYDRLRSFSVQPINSPSTSWAELTSPYSIRNLSDPSLTQYELDNLSKHKRYEIRLSVYNAVGEGPTSSPQEVFVGEAVPTAPPQNVAIQSATATQLDVTWDPPPLDTQNGDIQGYKIYFWEYQRKNETEKLRTLFLPEGGVKLKNLTGYTTYMISVAPFNAAGDGPRSPPTRGRTQQAAPSAPSFIHFSELTTTSVNVSWGEPVFPNGIIEGYRLIYEPCTPVDEPSVACADCLDSPSPSGVSKIVTVDVKGGSPLWLKIKDLADGVTYNFRIRAKTFTYGPEVEANITTGPGEGAPGPPGEPFISRYGAALTIHWTNGDPGRAPITRYVIEARPSDEGLWDILIKDIPKEVTSYTFNMDILKQGVSYDFRVIGVNDYGYGSPSQPSPSISAQKVAPFYEEWWFLVVVALVGLIFILLLVFILIIRGQSKKYAKKSDSSNNSNCKALTHGEMVSLDEGRFPALELNNRRLSVKNSFCRKNGVYTRPVQLCFSHDVFSDCHGVTQNGSGSSSVTSPALVLVETPNESVCGGTVVSTEMNGLLSHVQKTWCPSTSTPTAPSAGTVSPPRPSPGGLHYSDEDISTKYNDLIPAESSSLTEKPSEISDSQSHNRQHSEYQPTLCASRSKQMFRDGFQKQHSTLSEMECLLRWALKTKTLYSRPCGKTTGDTTNAFEEPR